MLDRHGHRKGTGNCHLQAQIPKFKTQGLQGDADDPMTPEPVLHMGTGACGSQGRWRHTTGSKPRRGGRRDGGVSLPAASLKTKPLGDPYDSL